MLGGMSRLLTKSDVLSPVIALLLCGMIGGTLYAFAKTHATQVTVIVIFGGVFLAVFVPTLRRLAIRARKLLAGRCPNPLCHGVVHHSELVPRGFVVCPTCKKTWPEIKGMQFKVTVRQG